MALFFYRSIEIDKNMALQQHKGNYKANMALSLGSISDLHWWVTNLPTAFKAITIDCPTIDATTDASKLGAGGSIMDNLLRVCGPLMKNKTTSMNLNQQYFFA